MSIYRHACMMLHAHLTQHMLLFHNSHVPSAELQPKVSRRLNWANWIYYGTLDGTNGWRPMAEVDNFDWEGAKARGDPDFLRDRDLYATFTVPEPFPSRRWVDISLDRLASARCWSAVSACCVRSAGVAWVTRPPSLHLPALQGPQSLESCR